MSPRQRFAKTVSCPTNEALLAFLQRGNDPADTAEDARLIEHLVTCEFCNLTLELLRAHPGQVPGQSDATPIPPVPASLRQIFSVKPCHK